MVTEFSPKVIVNIKDVEVSSLSHLLYAGHLLPLQPASFVDNETIRITTPPTHHSEDHKIAMGLITGLPSNASDGDVADAELAISCPGEFTIMGRRPVFQSFYPVMTTTGSQVRMSISVSNIHIPPFKCTSAPRCLAAPFSVQFGTPLRTVGSGVVQSADIVRGSGVIQLLTPVSYGEGAVAVLLDLGLHGTHYLCKATAAGLCDGSERNVFTYIAADEARVDSRYPLPKTGPYDGGTTLRVVIDNFPPLSMRTPASVLASMVTFTQGDVSVLSPLVTLARSSVASTEFAIVTPQCPTPDAGQTDVHVMHEDTSVSFSFNFNEIALPVVQLPTFPEVGSITGTRFVVRTQHFIVAECESPPYIAQAHP